MQRDVNPRAVVALGAALLLWASAFAGIRVGLEAYSPGHLALLRFLVGSAGLLVYALITRIRPPEARDMPAVLAGGFLAFTVYHVALNYGEVTVTAGAASLLISTAPVFTALLSATFSGERLGAVGWAGLGVGFFGASLVVFGGSESVGFDPRALLVILGALAASVYFAFQGRYVKKYGSLTFTTHTIWAGTLFMLVFLPGLAGEVAAAPLGVTLSVVYLGVGPTVLAYVAVAYASSQMGASVAVSSFYLIPVLAFVIAYLWLGEVPSVLSVTGGVVALMGVLVVTTRGDAGQAKGAEAEDRL